MGLCGGGWLRIRHDASFIALRVRFRRKNRVHLLQRRVVRVLPWLELDGDSIPSRLQLSEDVSKGVPPDCKGFNWPAWRSAVKVPVQDLLAMFEVSGRS